MTESGKLAAIRIAVKGDRDTPRKPGGVLPPGAVEVDIPFSNGEVYRVRHKGRVIGLCKSPQDVLDLLFELGLASEYTGEID